MNWSFISKPAVIEEDEKISEKPALPAKPERPTVPDAEELFKHIKRHSRIKNGRVDFISDQELREELADVKSWQPKIGRIITTLREVEQTVIRTFAWPELDGKLLAKDAIPLLVVAEQLVIYRDRKGQEHLIKEVRAAF